MDGFSSVENIAGRGVGLLSALASIKGGGLANYMLARQRMMTDPAYRASFIDAPFTAGFFGLGQGAPPTAAAQAQVAQPAGGGGPPPAAAPQDVRYLPTGGTWYPGVAPLDYAQQVKAEQDRATMIGLTSNDPAIRTQSKLSIGVPLSQEEMGQAVGAGRELVRQAGPGSQVQYKLPGGAVTVGSPYISGNYLDQNAAAVVAQRTGGVVVPSPSGGFEVKAPERPVQGEYTDPNQAAAVRQPGEVTKPTGRTVNGVPTYYNVKQEPVGVAPLPTAPAARPAPPAPVRPAVPVTPPPPAAEPPAPAPAPAAAPPPPPPPPPPASQAAPAPPPPPPHEIVRQRPDGSFEPVAPPPPPAPAPRAEAAPITAPPLLAAAGPSPFQMPWQGAPAPAVAAPAPIMVARAEPPPYQLVPGAELGGIVSGAPPAPAEQRLPAVPATAVPWTPTPAGQPAAQPAATPPGMPVGTETFTQTQPIEPRLGGGTKTFAGETPGKREADLEMARRRAEVEKDVASKFGSIPQTKELDEAYRVRSDINDLLNGYTPKERAGYVGYVEPYLRRFWSGNDPRYQRFLDLNTRIHAALGGEKSELPLPTGYESTPAQYESALRSSADTVDKIISVQAALANMHPADLTPDQQRKFINERMSDPSTVHFGPYPWDEKTGAPISSQATPTSSTTTTTSPFLVDRRYTIQPAQ